MDDRPTLWIWNSKVDIRRNGLVLQGENAFDNTSNTRSALGVADVGLALLEMSVPDHIQAIWSVYRSNENTILAEHIGNRLRF
jgi:hypothetical protein